MRRVALFRFHFIAILIALICFTSCDSRTKEVTEESYPDGSPKLVRVYEEKNGTQLLVKERHYYPNRQKRMEGSFRDDERDGKWVYYFENGKIWSEGSFRLGKSDGRRITYYENGNKRYEGEYRNGIKTGVWHFYDEQGSKVKEVDYSKEKQGEEQDAG